MKDRSDPWLTSTSVWLIKAIGTFKGPMQRPTAERVCRAVRQTHTKSNGPIFKDEVFMARINQAVSDAKILKVCNKRQTSYKEPNHHTRQLILSKTADLSKSTTFFCSERLGTSENNSQGEQEALISCPECGSSVHPSCLKRAGLSVPKAEEQDGWLCSECKRCNICRERAEIDPLLIFSTCVPTREQGFHVHCLSQVLHLHHHQQAQAQQSQQQPQQPQLHWSLQRVDRYRSQERHRNSHSQSTWPSQTFSPVVQLLQRQHLPLLHPVNIGVLVVLLTDTTPSQRLRRLTPRRPSLLSYLQLLPAIIINPRFSRNLDPHPTIYLLFRHLVTSVVAPASVTGTPGPNCNRLSMDWLISHHRTISLMRSRRDHDDTASQSACSSPPPFQLHGLTHGSHCGHHRVNTPPL